MEEPFTIWGERPGQKWLRGHHRHKCRTIPTSWGNNFHKWVRQNADSLAKGATHRGTGNFLEGYPLFGGAVPESGQGLHWEERASHLCDPRQRGVQNGPPWNYSQGAMQEPRYPHWGDPLQGCSILEEQHLRPKWVLAKPKWALPRTNALRCANQAQIGFVAALIREQIRL